MPNHYQLEKYVSFTTLDDEAVLLNLQSGAYFGLNHVGAMLIIELENGSELSQVEAKIAKTYGVPATQVTQDISKLLNQMLAQKLIRLL